ncbi:hypothetical protein DPMN_192517 [Dreissena polymorpha]|uniref:Uncharacterized protein n=1 Tax=Dreissena polymorpha TaxID=45954 RepID=A0A9D3Y5T0_DREPO|nr:hypothetical protein DPMN_192517 [Dreissena polymorpha]
MLRSISNLSDLTGFQVTPPFRIWLISGWSCVRQWLSHSKTGSTSGYLETGNTHSEGDSMHSAMESASQNIPVSTTSQWATIIRNANHKTLYRVHEMTLKDFIFIFKD